MIEHIPEIGIVDTRTIIQALRDMYGYDFDDYALTSFKHKLEKLIHHHKLKYADSLINKLKNDKGFFDIFLKDISVGSTEMFRDPSLWKVLKDDLFFKEINKDTTYKIWLPQCVSGDELYTLCIVLKELGLLPHVEITVSTICDPLMEQIQSGFMPHYKIEISDQNYLRYKGEGSLSQYYVPKGSDCIRDQNIIKKARFLKQHINFEDIPGGFDLIIFRNKLIYYNPVMVDKVLIKISESLHSGGHLVIGTKERLLSNSVNSKFSLILPSESIYKKK